MAAVNLPIPTSLAEANGGSFALLAVTVPVFVAVIVLTALGREDRGARFGRAEAGDEAVERLPTGRFTREPAGEREQVRSGP